MEADSHYFKPLVILNLFLFLRVIKNFRSFNVRSPCHFSLPNHVLVFAAIIDPLIPIYTAI